MEIDLKGRTALVTGGNVGIGRAIAIALAENGADVVITRFSHDSTTVADIRALGRQAWELQLDATDPEQVDRVVAEAAALLGGHIDILVNNSGGMLARVPLLEMSVEHWRKVIEVNMGSAFYVTHAVAPFMNAGWGRVVNVSSLAGRNGGGKGAGAYSAAKAGMSGLTRAFAKELAGRGVTVNAVAPGMVLGTAFHDLLTPIESQRATIAHLLVGRAGTPNDVAALVLFLASDLSGYITGEVVEINGGEYFG